VFFRFWLLVPLVGTVLSSCGPAPVEVAKKEGFLIPPDPQPRRADQTRALTPEEERQQREEEFKKKAVSVYPELGVAGTAVNREYVRRYKLYRSVNPAFFEEPDWPVRLAEMLAQDLGLDPRR